MAAATIDFINTTGNSVVLTQADGSLRTIAPSLKHTLTVVQSDAAGVVHADTLPGCSRQSFIFSPHLLPPHGSHLIVSSSVACNMQGNNSWPIGWNIYRLTNDTSGTLVQLRLWSNDNYMLAEYDRRKAILAEKGVIGPRD